MDENKSEKEWMWLVVAVVWVGAVVAFGLLMAAGVAACLVVGYFMIRGLVRWRRRRLEEYSDDGADLIAEMTPDEKVAAGVPADEAKVGGGEPSLVDDPQKGEPVLGSSGAEQPDVKYVRGQIRSPLAYGNPGNSPKDDARNLARISGHEFDEEKYDRQQFEREKEAARVDEEFAKLVGKAIFVEDKNALAPVVKEKCTENKPSWVGDEMQVLCEKTPKPKKPYDDGRPPLSAIVEMELDAIFREEPIVEERLVKRLRKLHSLMRCLREREWPGDHVYWGHRFFAAKPTSKKKVARPKSKKVKRAK